MLGARLDANNMIFKVNVNTGSRSIITVNINQSEHACSDDTEDESVRGYYNDMQWSQFESNTDDDEAAFSGSESDVSACSDENDETGKQVQDNACEDLENESIKFREVGRDPREHSCSLTRSSGPDMGAWMRGRRARARQGRPLSVVHPGRNVLGGLCADRGPTEEDDLPIERGLLASENDEREGLCDVTADDDVINGNVVPGKPPLLFEREPPPLSREIGTCCPELPYENGQELCRINQLVLDADNDETPPLPPLEFREQCDAYVTHKTVVQDIPHHVLMELSNTPGYYHSLREKTTRDAFIRKVVDRYRTKTGRYFLWLYDRRCIALSVIYLGKLFYLRIRYNNLGALFVSPGGPFATSIAQLLAIYTNHTHLPINRSDNVRYETHTGPPIPNRPLSSFLHLYKPIIAEISPSRRASRESTETSLQPRASTLPPATSLYTALQPRPHMRVT